MVFSLCLSTKKKNEEFIPLSTGRGRRRQRAGGRTFSAGEHPGSLTPLHSTLGSRAPSLLFLKCPTVMDYRVERMWIDGCGWMVDDGYKPTYLLGERKERAREIKKKN